MDHRSLIEALYTLNAPPGVSFNLRDLLFGEGVAEVISLYEFRA